MKVIRTWITSGQYDSQSNGYEDVIKWKLAEYINALAVKGDCIDYSTEKTDDNTTRYKAKLITISPAELDDLLYVAGILSRDRWYSYKYLGLKMMEILKD